MILLYLLWCSEDDEDDYDLHIRLFTITFFVQDGEFNEMKLENVKGFFYLLK